MRIAFNSSGISIACYTITLLDTLHSSHMQPDVDKLVKQLYKLVFVESVRDLNPEPYVSQELLLVKVGDIYLQSLASSLNLQGVLIMCAALCA